MFHKTVTEELEQVAGVLRKLPNTHPLYSSFFRFEDGPPNTSHELNGWGDNLLHPYLMAAMRGDRIAVLYSNKDYSSEWNFHPDNKRFYSVDNTRFGVNLVVYALTRWRRLLERGSRAVARALGGRLAWRPPRKRAGHRGHGGARRSCRRRRARPRPRHRLDPRSAGA
jgi:hypothetical protein